MHQCLQCGKLFEAGSGSLLQGCTCGGTRFFFTQQALDARARNAITDKANKDLRALVQELMASGRPNYDDPLWSREKWAEWVKLDANAHRADTLVGAEVEDVEEALSKPRAKSPARVNIHQIADAARPAGAPAMKEEAWPPPLPAPPGSPASPSASEGSSGPAAIPEAAEAPPAPAPAASVPREALGQRPPETIRIAAPGQYDIDLEALLQDNPIIVQRDGVYMVHLPSAFAKGRSGR